jgi:type VI protein secretion system component Hcp
MKKIFLLAIVILAISLKKSYAQPAAGVYLFCNTITNGCGTGTHPDEVATLSKDEGVTATIGFGQGGGPTIGRPLLADFVITKEFDRSSMRFRNRIIRGQALPDDVEIRYYNGIANIPVYRVILQNCFVTSILNNNEQCVGGCPGISETFSFTAQTIIWRNQAITPNQVISFNISTGVVSSSGL